jgi:hypothetical protein
MIIKNKLEIKDLKIKLDENNKVLSLFQSNAKQLEFDKSLEITKYKQQLEQIFENLENLKTNQTESDLKNEKLVEQIYMKEVLLLFRHKSEQSNQFFFFLSSKFMN